MPSHAAASPQINDWANAVAASDERMRDTIVRCMVVGTVGVKVGV